MRLIFHNTSDASQVTGDTPGSVTEKDLEEGLKARDEDLEQLRVGSSEHFLLLLRLSRSNFSSTSILVSLPQRLCGSVLRQWRLPFLEF